MRPGSRGFLTVLNMLDLHLMKRLRDLKKHFSSTLKKKPDRSFFTLLAVALLIFGLLYAGKELILKKYASLQSAVLLDRNGVSLSISPNTKGEYSRYADELPPRVADLIVLKEDRFFYFHPGVNPVSIIRPGAGASTITMQLVKNVLGHETDRSVLNKIKEVFLALDIELFLSKKAILAMYANTVYLGNNIQGLAYGSEAYFGRPLEDLNEAEITSLLSALASPSSKNPWSKGNAAAREALAIKLGVAAGDDPVRVAPREEYNLPYNLELSSILKPGMGPVSQHGMTEENATTYTTLDAKLTDQLRDMLKWHVDRGWNAGVHTGAIVVLKMPENEILAMVGSPEPGANRAGAKINMVLEPRPIGSTIKPFIYLKGFEAGLRPYSLVDDREYKFPTADGFPLYPKNYDGLYRGLVSLHYALSNSLNVPSVKVLERVGLENFYAFLEQGLDFRPLRDLDSYQYGIALGGLEMDTLTLARLFSIFPQEGVLKPLKLFNPAVIPKPRNLQQGQAVVEIPRLRNDSGDGGTVASPMSADAPTKQIADPKHIELVSRVLNDRNAGVEQFGLASSLNLSQRNYAVKTGTSYDFHDSWTIGYTPDFLVAVWLGNAENTALKQVSGAEGAGAVWHDAMEILMNSPYNKRTPISFGKTSNVQVEGSTDFGLPGDNVSDHRDLLIANRQLITSPHDGDIFQLESDTIIPLTASERASWYVDGQLFAQAESFDFQPTAAKTYTIEATAPAGKRERIQILLK